MSSLAVLSSPILEYRRLYGRFIRDECANHVVYSIQVAIRRPRRMQIRMPRPR
jgi:hypothetical protein